MTWANRFFSERTIIRAMRRLAMDEPRIAEWYPGLGDSPVRVRDLRRYQDLNDITYAKFQRMAARCGFKVEMFSVFGTRLGKVIGQLPFVRNSKVNDILSTGAGAYLRKPA
jgi:hypothetical protein